MSDYVNSAQFILVIIRKIIQEQRTSQILIVTAAPG